MARAGVATITTLMEAARALDVRRIACEAGLKAEGLDGEELAPGTELAGIVTFLQAATNGTVDVVLALLLILGGVVGAPVGSRLAAKLPGVKFLPVVFRPSRSAYRSKLCRGIRLVITNRRKVDAMRTFITMAREVHKHLPEKGREKNWQRIAHAVGDSNFIDSLAKGEAMNVLLTRIAADVKAFQDVRQKYLLYP